MNDYIYYYLLAVNILAFVLFGVDKQKARFAIGVPVILLVQIGVVCLVQWAMK